MKLEQVLEMLSQFGFEPEHVRRTLALGDSPFNAYEGLKTLLELRWSDMNQTEGIERLKELRPVYEQLMRLKLKSARTPADVERERQARIDRLTHITARGVEEQKRRNLRAFVSELDRMRGDSPKLDEFLRDLEKER